MNTTIATSGHPGANHDYAILNRYLASNGFASGRHLPRRKRQLTIRTRTEPAVETLVAPPHRIADGALFPARRVRHGADRCGRGSPWPEVRVPLRTAWIAPGGNHAC
jgi:hypothetical protein